MSTWLATMAANVDFPTPATPNASRSSNDSGMDVIVTRLEGGIPIGFRIVLRILAKFSEIDGSVIAFAGRRVIEQTIKEDLPDNFQTSEYLFEHGFIDLIIPRTELTSKLKQILSFHYTNQ